MITEQIQAVYNHVAQQHAAVNTTKKEQDGNTIPRTSPSRTI